MKISHFFFLLFYASFLSFVIFFSIISFFFYQSKNFFIDEHELISIKKKFICDDLGNIICEFKDKKIDNINFFELPIHCIQAFLSKEDSRFFEHRGISISAIFRSIIVNLKRGKFVQGGSTITQQMIKLKKGNLKKTWSRKLYEQIMALIIESKFSKEEIFQEYLRVLYFGSGIVGITEAAKNFWNKNPSDLNILESATLAGIIQNPEKFNPRKNYSECLKRRNFVLKRMVQDGYLKKNDYEKYIKEPISLESINSLFEEEQIILTIKKFNIDKYNSNDFLGEEIIFYTTFNKNLQKIICSVFLNKFEDFKKTVDQIEGGCILVDLENGEIKAIVQNYDSKKTSTLHATNMYRQIGSLIKPLIYYYAFENGDNKYSIYDDSPLENEFKWNPNNFNKKFSGNINVEKALIESNNIVSIRVLKKYGIDKFINFLSKIDLFKNVEKYYSLALGCLDSSIINISEYISLISLNGFKKPFFCKKIKNSFGNLIYRHEENSDFLIKKENFNQKILEELNDILLKIGDIFQKKMKINLKNKIIAKTGTTNGSKNCWFMGANKKYALVVYVGTDFQENLIKKNITSFNSAALIGIKIFEKLDNL